MQTIFATVVAISTILVIGCARNAPSVNSPTTNALVGQNGIAVRHQPTTATSTQAALPMKTPSTNALSSTSSDVDGMLIMLSATKAPAKVKLVPAGL